MATYFVASLPDTSSPNTSSSVSSPEQPHHNPCAQCGHTIAQPSWSEGDARLMAFVWSCDDCGYEFMTIAMYPQVDEHRRIAA